MPIVTTVRTTDDAVHILTWHDIAAIWIKGKPTIENQRETETLVLGALGRHADRYGAFVIINGELHPPTFEVRHELDMIYNRLTQRLQGVAYVILGRGFQTAVIRATLIGSNWLSRRPYPTSVSGDLKKGIGWLYYTLPKDPERGEMNDFLDALGSMMQGEAPETLRGKRRR